MRKIVFILVSLSFILAQSFSNFSFVGTKSMAMAGAVVSDIDDIESVLYNPAGLVNSDKYSMIIGNSSLYDLGFLNHNFLSISFPNRMAVSIQELATDSKGSFLSFGSVELSKESAISFSQGFHLLDDANSTLSIGYNINALIFSQAGSAGPNGDGTLGLPAGKSNSISVDIGIHAALRDKINFGAFVKNINNPTIGKGSSQSHFPRLMNLGITYNPFDDLYTTFAFERVLGEDKTSFRFGAEYDLNNSLTLRSGIQMNPNRFGLGFCYSLEKIQLSYSLLTHSILSSSNVISIRVNFE